MPTAQGRSKKVDCPPVAKKYLQHKKVILHTGGAKSYRLKTTFVDGILHDRVVHKKKKITVGGKTVWVRPKYVRLFVHKLPDGRVLCTKGGTQIIDRFWQFLRAHIGTRSDKVDSSSMTARVRSAQWLYWNRGEDHWLATGRMIQSLG